MSWVYLIIAGGFEVVWAISLKYATWPKLDLAAATLFGGMILSVVFLWLAVKGIPIAIAYAAWTGLGVCGIFIIDYFFLHAPITSLQVIFLCLVVIGIIGLKLSGQ